MTRLAKIADAVVNLDEIIAGAWYSDETYYIRLKGDADLPGGLRFSPREKGLQAEADLLAAITPSKAEKDSEA